MLPNNFRTFSVFIIVLFFSNISIAQNKTLYSYQDLSKFYFKSQKDSLKKSWVCPQVFTNKTTQKKYKEIWDSRTDFITEAIDNNDFIYDVDLYNYINGIITDLKKSNATLLTQSPFLILDRSAAVNAYALGGNVIAVNLGLITFAQSREEIALVIAHELSHNILKHPENSMKERAAWLTSDEYKNSLNAVLDSKYERFTRLKKVLETYTFSRNKHSRYHESDADSLAIVMLRNSNISFDPRFFLRLDSTDNAYQLPLKSPVKNYFASYNMQLDDAWFTKRSKGLSSRNYNFKDTTSLNDSLKTHPDCVERFEKTKNQASAKISLTAIPSSIKDRANKMLLWNMYDNLSLTPCLYRIFLEKDKGNTDPWFDFMTYNIIAGLYYSNLQLNRFNAIGIIPKEYISKNYYELQNMLEQIPSDKLEDLYKSAAGAAFWSGMPSDAKGMKTLFATLNNDDKNAKAPAAAKDYINSNPSSMYCEFAEHFKK